ncbi:hypothetical protein ACFCXP_03500 [Streptomyces niveus]|uniref:hypothetical protein n=1 Tax=Streptomyces niveus TaxID=193462 RepID=UPI0035D8A708
MNEVPPDGPVRNQRNTGSGTFIGRDLIGNVLNIFFRSRYEKTAHVGRRKSIDDSGDGAEDEVTEETPRVRFLLTAGLGYLAAYAARACAVGVSPIGDGALDASMAGRIFYTGFWVFVLVACVGYAFSCLAEILADWADSAAESAVSNAAQWRIVATINSMWAHAIARASGGSAALASVIALVLGWCPLGHAISSRAHNASRNADIAAVEARAAVRGHEG